MAIVELTEICKSYGHKIIFDRFNLKIDSGEYIAIMGASGKGKTTLLNIIGLVEDINSGCVEIFGFKNPKFYQFNGTMLLRKKISYLFQNFGLIEDKSVWYNMKIATKFLKCGKNEEKNIISKALNTMDLNGYEKKKIFELSGGEQQRVALAKILVKPSDIILADEPTGSLDHNNRDLVMNMLSKLNNNGKTVVVVTHDSEVANCCKKIINL